MAWPPAMPNVPLASLSRSIKRRRTAGEAGSAGSRASNLKGEGLQRVADQDRRRLVVGLVAGRAPAAQVVVVHGRKVVVHQRIHVDQLDGAGGRLDLILGESQRARGGEQQRGPDALAAAEHAVAHRLMQTLRDFGRARGRRLSSARSMRDCQALSSASNVSLSSSPAPATCFAHPVSPAAAACALSGSPPLPRNPRTRGSGA